MTANKKKLLCWLLEMSDSENFLKMDVLKNNHSYQIYAMNSYVGVWVEAKKAFLIARYKIGPNPYLFFERHCDAYSETGYGTVKPIKLIEPSPFIIEENFDVYKDNETKQILDYLQKLEKGNPVINGFNTVESRKSAAIKFEERLSSRTSLNKYRKCSE